LPKGKSTRSRSRLFTCANPAPEITARLDLLMATYDVNTR
jgi:hypothetical protein